MFFGVSGNPDILEEAERGLVCVVLCMQADNMVVDERNRPELGDLLHDWPALFEYRVQLGEFIAF